MSRIGKLPIEIPQGVEVTINGQTVTAKGPMGTETVTVRDEIKVSIQDKTVLVERRDEERKTRALHGLSRTLVANAINGVKDGFEKKLEIQGVGYRAQMQGTTLNLQLGYSHPVNIEPPAGIQISVEAGKRQTSRRSPEAEKG